MFCMCDVSKQTASISGIVQTRLDVPHDRSPKLVGSCGANARLVLLMHGLHPAEKAASDADISSGGIMLIIQSA